MYIKPLLGVLLAVVTVSGCTENPLIPEHDDDLGTELVAEVALSIEHLVTLTEFTVSVHVEDAHGEHVTEMEEVRAEFRHHEAEDWAPLILTLDGEEFTATHMLMSSGDYDFRVVGVQHGSVQEVVLYEASDHMEVERIHQEVGGYIVEFETFPGDVHEGDEAVVTFWIIEVEGGQRHMMEGLHAEIHVTDGDGSTMEHDPHEEQAGMYEAHHTFVEAGQAHFEISFEGANNAEHHAEFQVPVSHGH